MDLHLIGAGGHARVIVGLAWALGLNVAGVYDDRPDAPPLLGVPVLGRVTDLPDQAGTQAVVAVGDNRARARVAGQFARVTWATLIHPAAWVSPDASLGPGTVVMAGAVVQPGSRLGAHVVVNTGATVDHDCVLADFVHVAPGSHLAGGVSLGQGAFGGVGSSYLPGVRVGAWTTVGAGAVVTRDLPERCVAAGVPARVRRSIAGPT